MTLEQTSGFRLVHDQLDLYREHAESWKDAHDAAMECRDFEELLAFGVHLFERINRLEEHWREQVTKGLIEYDAATDQVFADTYRRWASFSDGLMARLSKLEEKFDVEGADAFRRAWRETQGILTPDEDFFTSPAFVTLRDQAIDAHRRGETTEIKELSD